jgi:hypothetical protein
MELARDSIPQHKTLDTPTDECSGQQAHQRPAGVPGSSLAIHQLPARSTTVSVTYASHHPMHLSTTVQLHSLPRWSRPLTLDHLAHGVVGWHRW